jgi:hypothetical protein
MNAARHLQMNPKYGWQLMQHLFMVPWLDQKESGGHCLLTDWQTLYRDTPDNLH